jgi:pilus assembly protein CpaC
MRITAIGRRLFILLLLTAVPHLVWADEPGPVRLLVGRSAVIDVGTPISRVSLTSSDVADAMVTSSQQLLVNGKMPGTISMFVWERTGAIHKYEIVVQRDLARLNDQMKTLFPGESIDAQSNGKSVVLSGTVSNKDVSERAIKVAAGYVDKADEVVNLLRMQESQASNQVLLRVRFAEVSRSAMTELGTSLFTGAHGYKDYMARTTTQQFDAPVFDNSNPEREKLVFSDFLNLFLFDTKHQLGTVIKALQNKGQFQSLAEPNLVAESGKEASFLAGGEFPVPIAQGSGNGVAISVQYKEFGVRLNFTPTVNGNRVHLKVRPEVSTLDFANGVVLQGFRIPALSTRRTETELELMDGQTFAIAGLMNNSVNSTLQKIPGIGDIPILGLLFKSKAAQKNQTELVVMITPQILPRSSSGVTSTLPRTPEPYMAPLPPKALHDVPPPAFPPARGADKASPAAGLSPVADKPSSADALPPVSDKPSPEAAAAAMSALSSSKPVMMPESAPTAAPSGTSAARPLTGDEKKSLERAQNQEAQAKEAAAKAQAIDAKAQAKQAERDAKLAREQAQRDEKAAEVAAVQAKKQAEIDAAEAKRQAELQKARQKTLDEAAMKAKAAEAKYQAELAKKQK